MKANGCTRRSWAGEKLLTLKELAKELIRSPDSPVKRSHWTLRRWASDGVEIGRARLRLATTQPVPGIRHSSVQAVQEFWDALAEAGQ
jgi:hypothetical protein